MSIVRANSREPVANEGDIFALIACCESGAERLIGLMNDFALDDLQILSDHIITASRRGTLEAIAAIPNGTYHNELQVDGYEKPLTLKASLTITDECLSVDFDGTSECSVKGINVPLNYATCLLYTSPSPRDRQKSRMPSSA